MRPSWSQQKRPRISVGKMFGMPQGRALVWLPGDEAPRVSRIKGYFELPLNRFADVESLFHGKQQKHGRHSSPPVAVNLRQ